MFFVAMIEHPVITLTTDWGRKDPYLASLKGRILSLCPTATLVDISHEVPVYNITAAEYVLKKSFRHFPKNSIHIVSVNGKNSEYDPCIVVASQGHFFIGRDNGIISSVTQMRDCKIARIERPEDMVFPERDIFPEVAACLIAEEAFDNIGTLVSDFEMPRIAPRAIISDNRIEGRVVWIDGFGNIITNITQDEVTKWFQPSPNRKVEIKIPPDYYISIDNDNDMNFDYSSNDDGQSYKISSMFNADGVMEIFIPGTQCSPVLSINIGDPIVIQYV